MATAKKLPSGSYRVNLYIGTGTKDGKRKYKSITAETKKEAEFLAAQYNLKRKEKPSAMTVGEAYEKYIASKENILSPATVREYERSARCDLQPIMNIKLENLTQEIIQSAINTEAKTHAPKSVRNMHGLLSSVLAMFYPDFKLNTTLPEKAEINITVPVDDEIKLLLDNASPRIRKAILLSAFGSLRRSEISSLNSNDIVGNTVIVNKAMVRDKDKKWVLKVPKTYAGYRKVEMPPFIIQQLTPEPDGRIVGLLPSGITNDFVALRNRLGLKMRFHDMRHYQASILHAIGVPDKYIMERGGWKTDSTLKNIYQHTMSDKSKEFSEKANSYFEKFDEYATQNATHKDAKCDE